MAEITNKQMENKINKVAKIYNDYQKGQIKNGGNFNICSILRKTNDEVNLHSRFIYELINPDGSHMQEDIFLELFITDALDIGKNKDDIPFIFEDIKVKREDLTDDNRRIDFTIESSNYLIGIEMKIDASDQDKQMYNYYKELKTRNEKNKSKKIIKLYYLTKYGNEPSKQSLYYLTNKNYDLLSFSIDIEWWLRKCIEKTKIVKLQESIKQYLEVIQKITGQLPKEVENQMDNLVKNSNDIEILHNISQDYPRIWAQKEVKFWNELYNKLNKATANGKKIINDIYLYGKDLNDNDLYYDMSVEDKTNIIKYNRHRHKAFYCGILIKQKIKKYTLEIEIYQWDGNDCLYIEINLYNTRYNHVDNKILQEKLDEIGFNGLSFKKLKENLQLTFYAKDVSNPTFELFDDEKFKDYISEYAKEIKKILKIIDDNKDDIVK